MASAVPPFTKIMTNKTCNLCGKDITKSRHYPKYIRTHNDCYHHECVAFGKKMPFYTPYWFVEAGGNDDDERINRLYEQWLKNGNLLPSELAAMTAKEQ